MASTTTDTAAPAPVTTPARKTRGLTLNPDPIARMRELHDLDNPKPPSAPPQMAAPETSALPSQLATPLAETSGPVPAATTDTALASNTEIKQESKNESNITTKQSDYKASFPSSNQESRQETPFGRAGEQEIHRALRRALGAPYGDIGPRSPLITISTRVPSEIAERLDWSCSITGLKKQEVIGAALRDYFDKLAGEGE